MSVDHAKARLRDEARRRRQDVSQAAAGRAARQLCQTFDQLRRACGLAATGAAIAGYWPMAGEMDVRPVLEAAHAAGDACALPVVVDGTPILVFRRWSPGADLMAGVFGTRHPSADEPAVRPDMVLAPLLAFDAAGGRLGWGGGYYDHTIAALRVSGPVVAVGVAFADQEVDAVPKDDHDQALDWVITEEAVRRTGGG